MTDNYAAFCTSLPDAERATQAICQTLARAELHPNPTKSKIWRPNSRALFVNGSR